MCVSAFVCVCVCLWFATSRAQNTLLCIYMRFPCTLYFLCIAMLPLCFVVFLRFVLWGCFIKCTCRNRYIGLCGGFSARGDGFSEVYATLEAGGLLILILILILLFFIIFLLLFYYFFSFFFFSLSGEGGGWLSWWAPFGQRSTNIHICTIFARRASSVESFRSHFTLFVCPAHVLFCRALGSLLRQTFFAWVSKRWIQLMTKIAFTK